MCSIAMNESRRISCVATLPVLWQIRFSHSNEKARWALDHKRIAHQRRSVLPGLHVLQAKRLYGGETLPVLILDGEVIPDSARIIAALEARSPAVALYPADGEARERALALETHFDEELGEHVRRALFHDLLGDSRVAVEALTTGHGTAARLVYLALFPLLRPVIKSGLGIEPTGAERGREKIVAALERIEAELGPSGYLVGDAFTVADLTAAARLSPFLRPPQYPYPLPDRWSPRAEAFRDSIARRPAFAWALEMYGKHRGSSAAINE
jgi:glutathione S-transferase